MATETKNTKSFYNTDIPSDWEVNRLEDACSHFKSGFGITSEQIFDSGKYPVYGGNGLRGFTDTFTHEGDYLLIGRQGALCGNIHRVTDKVYISEHAIAVQTNKRNDIDFLAYKLAYKNLNRLSESSAQPGLAVEKLIRLKVEFPPLPEQRAIARVLSTADAAIHTTEKLITQKELRKKWLMQQLLTGKKRLKGFEKTKWRIQPLESFIKPVVREIQKPDVPYLGIGLRSHGKGTFLKHDELPEKNSMDKFYVVRPNDLIVNITFAWEQAIAIVRPEDDGALASHRFPTFAFNERKGHPDFFRFFILQPRMKFMLGMISPGGAGRNRVMSKSDFIKLEFSLPDYEEQTAIARVLQVADKEICLLKAKAEKLRELKKGLMQQLLTGKKRLNQDFQDSVINRMEKDKSKPGKSQNPANHDSDN